MADDPGQKIADALAVFINTQDLGFGFQCEAPQDPALTINFEGAGEPHSGTRCYVVPVSEVEERIDRGSVLVSPVVQLFVSRYLDDGVTRQTMGDFIVSLKDSIRFEAMAGFFWQEPNTITKYDPERLRTSDRFFSVLGITYSGVL